MRPAIAALALLLLALPAGGRDVAGVSVPTTVTEAGKTLHLNGAGVRTRFFFKVYVAALYLEQPGRDADAIVHTDAVKRIDLTMLRSLDAAAIAGSIGEAFERNSKDHRAALEGRLARLKAMFPAVRAGDVITLAYVPDRGTAVRVQGAARGVIEGTDFAEALFAVWLGPEPVEADLARALLGA